MYEITKGWDLGKNEEVKKCLQNCGREPLLENVH
jgi:hypothetical protein